MSGDEFPVSRRSLLKSGAVGGPIAFGGGSVFRELSPEDDNKQAITGRVVDVYGQPLADMRVVAYAPRFHEYDLDRRNTRNSNISYTTVGSDLTDEEGTFVIDDKLDEAVEKYLDEGELLRAQWAPPDSLKGFVLVADYPDEVTSALGGEGSIFDWLGKSTESEGGDALDWFGALEVAGENLFDPNRPHEIVVNNKKLFGPERVPSTDVGSTPEGTVSVWKSVDTSDPCLQHVNVEVEGWDGKLESGMAGIFDDTDVRDFGESFVQGIGPGILSLQVPEGTEVVYESGANTARKGRTLFLPNVMGDPFRIAPHAYLRPELSDAGQDVPLQEVFASKYRVLDRQRKRQIMEDMEADKWLSSLITTFISIGLGILGLVTGGTGAVVATIISTTLSVADSNAEEPSVPSPDDANRFFGNPDAAPDPTPNRTDITTADWPIVTKSEHFPLAVSGRTTLRFGDSDDRTLAARGLWTIQELLDRRIGPMRLDHGFEVDPSDVTPLETATTSESALDSMVSDSRLPSSGKRPQSDPLAGPQSRVTESEVIVPQAMFDQPRTTAPAAAGPDRSEEPLAPSGEGPLGMATFAMPLRNGESVEEFVRFEDGAPKTSTGLAEARTSLLFLWLDSRGLSLAVLHGEGADGGGGDLAFEGLPEEGEWVVGGQNVARDGDEWTVSLVSGSARAAAFRGLDVGCGTVTVTPKRWSGIDEWVVLDATGDGADAPERHRVEKGRPVVFRFGSDSTVTTDVLDDVGPEDRYFHDDFSEGYETAWTVLRREGDFSATTRDAPAPVPNPDLSLFGDDDWMPSGNTVLRLHETTDGATAGSVGWETPRYGWHAPWVARGLFRTTDVPLNRDFQGHSATLGEEVRVFLGFTKPSGQPRPFSVHPPGVDDPPTYDPGWQTGTWYHYEVRHDGTGTYHGRLWADGDGRPADPSVTVEADPLGADPRRSSIQVNGAHDVPLNVDHAFMAWNSLTGHGDRS